ncbi:MAG: pyruvate dehydrogenase (acetyl-transferring) E1 component subunit alpha [Solirubrobacteraceae bacterium]
MEIPNNVYLKWFRDMSLWRRFEDKCRSLYLKQKIRGFLHLYNGQEAIPAGLTHVMNMEKDGLITAYRCHVHGLAMGMNPKNAMAELMGKVTGSSKGMGGSMHFFSKEHRMYGGHGIVGGQIPLGAGLAFADKYFNREAVTICLMGDGAVRQGVLHETFNMAMTMKLPVVFICENNQYAMGTSVKRTANHENIYELARGYEMPSSPVDGMHPKLVAEGAKEAIDRARRGDGPTFLDIRTYRYRGHSVSDAQTYRTKEEVEKQMNENDPIMHVKKYIINNNIATEVELELLVTEVYTEIDEAIKFAENSSLPPLNQLFDFVYKEPNYPFIK